MSRTIIPKSDQINADDLLAGPITIKITGVSIKAGQEQPVSISYEGDEGKPYKACKSMCRVMVSLWGADAAKYVGRSMTLFCDPKVRWGGMEVGGIRISHMSDIAEPMTMALTVTRANKKPFTVRPIAPGTPKAPATQTPDSARTGAGDSPPLATSASAGATVYITPDEALALEARCMENDIDSSRLRKAAKVERLSMILAADHDKAKAWITSAIEQKKQPA